MPTFEADTGGRLARRGVLAGIAAFALATGLARPTTATPLARAQGLVSALAGEMTTLVGSGRSAQQLTGEFERILARYADMPAVAASILGQPWRGTSAAQKQAFVAAFQSYLARKYGRQFNEYRDARIELGGARDAGRSGVLVQTAVVRPGQQNIAVDWQISERGGSPKVVNLIIEGVSMLANERAEVGAMLDAQGGSVDALIGALRGSA